MLAYLWRLKGEQSVAAGLGTAVHAGAEAHWQGASPSEAVRDTLARELASVPTSEIAADPSVSGDATAMLTTYIEQVAPHFTPTMVERPFLVRVYDVILSGIIDAADEKTDELRDLKTIAGKTVNGKKPSTFDIAKHRVQMTLYSLGYAALTGRAPQRLLLDVINRRGKFKQYQIEPNYSELRDVIGLVRQGIERAEYPPTGVLSGACRFCPFRNSCSYSTEREAVA